MNYSLLERITYTQQEVARCSRKQAYEAVATHPVGFVEDIVQRESHIHLVDSISYSGVKHSIAWQLKSLLKGVTLSNKIGSKIDVETTQGTVTKCVLSKETPWVPRGIFFKLSNQFLVITFSNTGFIVGILARKYLVQSPGLLHHLAELTARYWGLQSKCFDSQYHKQLL